MNIQKILAVNEVIRETTFNFVKEHISLPEDYLDHFPEVYESASGAVIASKRGRVKYCILEEDGGVLNVLGIIDYKELPPSAWEWNGLQPLHDEILKADFKPIGLYISKGYILGSIKAHAVYKYTRSDKPHVYVSISK